MGTNYKHLSCEERTMIRLSLEQGCTLRAIARSVQRADTLTTMVRCPARLAPDGPLWRHVARLLREHHSPEQIAGGPSPT